MIYSESSGRFFIEIVESGVVPDVIVLKMKENKWFIKKERNEGK
jgi:hypothetical protein